MSFTHSCIASEPLEARLFLSAAAAHRPQAAVDPGRGAALAYAPHARVRGESVAELSAEWWSRVFETPVHAADGTTVTHPLMTSADTTPFGSFDGVFFLYGSFFGGDVALTATVPTGTPIFVPVLPVEFSNYDTSDPDGSLPGTYSVAELRDLSAQAAEPALGPGGSVYVRVDGAAVPDVAAHREVSPEFDYVLPPDNVDQFFFGDPSLVGQVPVAVADGFYVLLKPLSPGVHTIEFGGATPGGSLGPLGIDVTYTINVVPKGKFRKGQAAPPPATRVFSDMPVRKAGRVAEGVL